jgi:hemolysin activation/secretion protein
VSKAGFPFLNDERLHAIVDESMTVPRMTRERMTTMNFRSTLLVGASLLVPAVAHAQVDPASIERSIPQAPTVPPAPVASAATSVAVDPVRQESATINEKFVLSAVNVIGSTLFESSRLSTAFETKLADMVGPVDLKEIATAVTDIYHDEGYDLSYAVIPDQSVKSGIFTLKVVESYVADIQVKGPPSLERPILRLANQLKAERPLRTDTLNRVLGLIREIPGIAVENVQLSRFPGDPARQRLTIAIAGQRHTGFAYSDNRGTIAGARLRTYASSVANSLLAEGDQFQVDAFAIPSDRFRFAFGQIRAALPLGTSGLRLGVRASVGGQEQDLPGPDQRGFSRQLRSELAFPFLSSRTSSLIGSLSLTDWSSRERRDGSTVIRDRLQTVRAAIDFARRGSVLVTGRLDLVHGLDLSSSTKAGDPLASRPRAGANFAKAQLDVQIAAKLGESWTSRLEMTGQLSTRSLLASEEFMLGGARIGRAFDYSRVAGDRGAGAMLELAYKLPVAVPGIQNLESFAYVEGGVASRIRDFDATPDGALAGAGAGVRFRLVNFLCSVEVGQPLAAPGRNGSPRLFVSIARAF